MIVGVPNETYPGERRVALIPLMVAHLSKVGVDVWVEAGAGSGAGLSDADYTERGATIVASRDKLFAESDIIVQVRSFGANPKAGKADLKRHRKNQVVIGFSEPLAAPELAITLAKTGVTAFSMEMMPRITRAQSMDALSSMATITGYKAVLLAASELPRMFPLLMTAAGTVKPAQVFIIGAGVAGLQAIATARRLGAVVRAYDVRPVTREQVQSLGARFVDLEDTDNENIEDTSGYAKVVGEDTLNRQRAMIANLAKSCDVIISTAAVPGGRSPLLISSDAVKNMRLGSVIIDLAAERGGNCDLTKPGKTVDAGGVKVVGPVNLESSVPFHASQMYSKNIFTFLKHMLREGEFAPDWDDEIVTRTMFTKDGAVTNERLQQKLDQLAKTSSKSKQKAGSGVAAATTKRSGLTSTSAKTSAKTIAKTSGSPRTPAEAARKAKTAAKPKVVAKGKAAAKPVIATPKAKAAVKPKAKAAAKTSAKPKAKAAAKLKAKDAGKRKAKAAAKPKAKTAKSKAKAAAKPKAKTAAKSKAKAAAKPKGRTSTGDGTAAQSAKPRRRVRKASTMKRADGARTSDGPAVTGPDDE